MKKKVTFEKNIEFPTMIGEISEISLDHELKFIDETSVEGHLLLTGKYKMTEASRLEENFSYKIPCEIALTEKVDLNTTNIEISDFYYEIENENTLICHVELLIEGLELLEEEPILEREFIQDLNKACDLAIKDAEIHCEYSLLTNEMGLLKKIKDNIPSKVDERHIFFGQNHKKK